MFAFPTSRYTSSKISGSKDMPEFVKMTDLQILNVLHDTYSSIYIVDTETLRRFSGNHRIRCYRSQLRFSIFRCQKHNGLMLQHGVYIECMPVNKWLAIKGTILFVFILPKNFPKGTGASCTCTRD